MSYKEYVYVSHRQKRRRVIQERERGSEVNFGEPTAKISTITGAALTAETTATILNCVEPKPSSSTNYHYQVKSSVIIQPSSNDFISSDDYNVNNLENAQSKETDADLTPTEVSHMDRSNCQPYCALLENVETSDKQKQLSSIKAWVLNHSISHAAVSELLTLLRSDFSLSFLPADARTLMKTPRNVTLQIRNENGGEMVYFGFAESLLRSVKQHYFDVLPESIKINLNIDGLPLTKSSSSQFWPLLGAIVDDFYTEPFVIAIYHGFSKPDSSNDFLQNFVDEALVVLKHGIQIENKTVSIFINAIICDAPAKAFITCVKSHTGYFGCSKCIQEGEFTDNRITFPELQSLLRTDESFRNKLHPDHHKSVSVLESLEIGMVSQIPLDYMHLVCIGVTKRLIQFWVKGAMDVRLKPEKMKNISDNLLLLKSFITDEFARKPRCLEQIDRWKATELRQFLLYTGPVVLKNNLPKHLYKHFMVLSVAIRILADATLHLKLNSYAHSLLVWFVEHFPNFYGKKFLNYNVHNLIHLSQDVENLGPVDDFSAFKFENYMQKIKTKLKSSGKPLQQIINRLTEINHQPIEKPKKDSTCTFQSSNKWKKINFNNIFFLSLKDRDSFFSTDNGLFQMKDVFEKDSSPIIVAQKILNLNSFFMEPCNSQSLKIFSVNMTTNDGGENNSFHIPSAHVKRKYLKLGMGSRSEEYILMPLIHSRM